MGEAEGLGRAGMGECNSRARKGEGASRRALGGPGEKDRAVKGSPLALTGND